MPLYDTLPTPSSIRLLLIEPGLPTDELYCQLEIHELENAPHFKALSYVWGPQDPATSIALNGTPKDVGPNLAGALRRLRPLPAQSVTSYRQLQSNDILHSSRNAWSEFAKLSTELNFEDRASRRHIWIDALCINQDDLSERVAQVMLMKKIYERATKVIVWLGEEQKFHLSHRWLNRILWRTHLGDFGEMPIVLSFLAQAMRAVGLDTDQGAYWIPDTQGSGRVVNQSYGLPPLSDPEWEAMRSFFSRAWFSRVWVLQEVAVAQTAVVLVGEWETAWDAVADAATFFHQNGYSNIIEISGAAHAAHLWSQANPTPLLVLLRDARERLATDAKDKLYALLGLSQEISVPGHASDIRLRPDYTRTVMETYRDAASFIVETSQCFSIFSEVDHSCRDADNSFPSWVPQWHKERTTELSFDDINSHIYNAGGDSSALIHKSVDPGSLLISGLTVDIVRACEETSSALTEQSWKARLQGAWNTATANNTMYEATQDGMKALVEAFTLTATAGLGPGNTAAVFADSEQLLANLMGMRESGKGFETPSVWGQFNYILSSVMHPDRALSMLDLGDGFQKDVIQVWTGRTFFVTEKGYFGLGPLLMKAGDAVVVFFGGRVPYIVRKQSSTQSPTTVNNLGPGRQSSQGQTPPRQYYFIGESYVHGIMCGEAIPADRGISVATETFDLK